MPELPEVETIVRDLRQILIGRKIVGIRFLRKSVWRKHAPKADKMIGSRIISIGRKGKNILVNLSNGMTLIVHLKMTGKLTSELKSTPIAKHTHLLIELDSGQLRFNDIRRFGYLDLAETGKLNDLEYLKALGPDALEISKSDFINLIKVKKRIIKSLLLDQTFIAGLGNIYSDEALFLAGIHPKKVSSTLTPKKAGLLYDGIRVTLLKAIKNRGSSIDDYVDALGGRGSHQVHFAVYGRTGKPCPKCGKPIRRIVLGSRSTHFCSYCQR